MKLSPPRGLSGFRHLRTITLMAPPLIVAALTELCCRRQWQLPLLELCLMLPLLTAILVGCTLSWPWWERLLVLVPYAIATFFVCSFALFLIAGLHGDAM